jgi:hypothetical protein
LLGNQVPNDANSVARDDDRPHTSKVDFSRIPERVPRRPKERQVSPLKITDELCAPQRSKHFRTLTSKAGEVDLCNVIRRASAVANCRAA